MNSITNRQMVFLLFLTLTTYSTIDIPKTMAQSAGRSSWIPIIGVSILFAFVAVVITKLNNRFQGKVFFDYSQQIVGKFFAYLIAIYYLLYFFAIGTYLKIRLVGMMTSNFLPLTPPYVFLLFGIVLFAITAYKGVTNIARMFELFGITFLIITSALCFMMIQNGMISNILPLIDATDTSDYLRSIKNLIIPFGGIEILFIVPFTQINKKAPKTAFLTIIFIGLFYVLIVESTITLLGINNTIALNDAFIEAIKVVEVPIIERADIVYLTFGLSSLFAGMTIVFAAIVEFTCKVFHKVSRLIIVVITALALFSMTLFEINIKNIDELYTNIFIYFVLISGILIPTTMLILAKARKIN